MPIKMTPDVFYEAFAVGNYNEFIDEQSSVMKAFNSAVAASHLADCYFNYYKEHNPSLIHDFQNLTKFINFINERTNNLFKDIRSISNAYKHLYTGLKEDYARHSSISSAGTIESIIFVDEEVKDLSEEHMDESNGELKVVYTRKTGEQILFLKAIDCVIDFWKTMLYD
jgi:hypothetical protein